MSSKNSALASLTATYTDSENEDEHDSNSESSSNESDYPTSTTTSPKAKLDKSPIVPAIPSTKSARRLVSYNDDNVISDDENESENVASNVETVNMEISEEEENSHEKSEKSAAKVDQSAEYGFSLPAEPKGKCPQELQEKITNMHEKMKSGMDMNKLIQERKEFRNPSIYEKLIQYCDIDELGTNYQPEIYDPLQWGKKSIALHWLILFAYTMRPTISGKESFFEELARVQKLEMEKREKEKRENIKQELVLAATKKAEEEAKKRYVCNC